MRETDAPVLEARYFDGTHASEHPVTVQLVGQDLLVRGDGFERRVPASDVQWPEPTRHGPRVLHMASGGAVHCADGAAWDAWCRASGRAPGLVVRMQGSGRWVLASVAALVVLALALQRWGLPALAELVVAATPVSVDAAIGESALGSVDRFLLQPSQLPTAQQARLRDALRRFAAAQPPGTVPRWRLEFRSSRSGPNAFALPGGTMIMTDALATLFQHDEAVILGVLAHELGHLQHRHGLRMLVQGTVLTGVAAVVFGDFSALFAAAPALLGNASYSRAAEREADRVSARMLKAAGMSPLAMVRFFEVMAEQRRQNGQDTSEGDSAWSGISIASHPADAERIRFFRAAADD